MAPPQPDRSEQDQAGGLPPTPRSFADSLLPGSPPGAVWLTVCAWCDRVKVHGRWVEGERALELMKVPAGSEPSLTHGICPSCFSAEMSRSARNAA